MSWSHLLREELSGSCYFNQPYVGDIAQQEEGDCARVECVKIH